MKDQGEVTEKVNARNTVRVCAYVPRSDTDLFVSPLFNNVMCSSLYLYTRGFSSLLPSDSLRRV